jgi:hypothetical protein
MSILKEALGENNEKQNIGHWHQPAYDAPSFFWKRLRRWRD